ncbi:MAG TPA: hypothetical protein VHC46_05120 [Thermodesulfobacteriota bacterium]|nr:hypothetical protein [Thermodesulfobacteriota bacterium]
MRLRNLFKHKSVRVTSVLLFMMLLLGFQYACLDSLNGDSSGNPINTAIIGLSANPQSLFGNAGKDSVIQVNTNLVPDGTPIDFEITFSPTGLRPELRGCLFSSTGTVESNLAFVNYLAGVHKGVGATVEEIAADTATVNISATIHPVDGDEESDFITMTLRGVGMVAPDDQDITVPNPLDTEAEDIFLTLIFNTVGIEPGSIAEVSVSDPALGSLNDGVSVVQVPVLGSSEGGQFIVQYNAFRVGGTQIITAHVQLEVPPEFAAICPMPPADDLLIEAVVVITQTVESLEPSPSPSSSPTPTMTP